MMAEPDQSTFFAPWEPKRTEVPRDWMLLAEKLCQQTKGSLNEYVLDVKYDAQRVGNLLCSWGLPWQVVTAGYLWGYNEEQICRAELDDVDKVLGHIREAKLYAHYIEDENLPPLLTPPYHDLGGLLIAVAIYYVTLQAFEEQRGEQPCTEVKQSQMENIGFTLLNISKRLGIWHFKRDIEDLIEQLRSPFEFIEKKQQQERILEQDAQILEDTRQLLITSLQKATNKPIIVVTTPCGIAGLKRREQDAHTTATSQKKQLTGFDLATFDVIIPSVGACYAAFGVLSQLGFIQDRVTDQIANPKPNGCSHIALGLVLKAKTLPWLRKTNATCQLQIATPLMQAIASYGCLHPTCYQLYISRLYREKIEAFSEEQFWSSEEGKVLQAIKDSFADDQTKADTKAPIVVYDKNRTRISLPKGATALDFAFAANSSTGEHAVEAFINNRKAPLNRVLEAGDIVEVRTSYQVQASHKWLKDNYAITPVAQRYIKESLIRQFRDPEGYDLIRQVLERANYMLAQDDLEHEVRVLLGQHNLGTPQEFLERLDQEDKTSYTPDWIAREIMKRIAERNELISLEKSNQDWVPVLDTSSALGKKHVHQQSCRSCKPAYPRDINIVGRLSKRNGELVVHKEGCHHLTRRSSSQQSQLQPMFWQPEPSTFRVGFFVEAHDREALLLDIAELLTKHHCNMLYINAEVLKFDIAHFRFTIESHSDAEVLDIWQKLAKMDDVMRVEINAAATSQPIYDRLQKLRKQNANLSNKTTGDLLWEETIATLQRRSPVLKNPYDISRPATDNMFFGRTMEMKTMQRELCDGEYGKALILYGPLRSGKSSLCENFLNRYVHPPFWHILFSLYNATWQNEETILTNLTKEICRMFHDQLQQPAPNPADYNDNDPQTCFKRVLQDCLAQLPGTRLILALDEFGGALEAYKNGTLDYRFFGYWKDLVNEISQLSLVLAVPTQAHKLLISEEFSHVFSFTEHLPIVFLDHESAKRLLVDPLRDQQIAIHPSAATFAAKLTGNNPYYITILGQQLVHQLNREPRKQLVRNDDIRLVADKIIEAGSENNFVFHRKELQDITELRILKGFIEMTSGAKQLVLSLKKIAANLGLPSALVRPHLERLRNGLILEEHISSESGRSSANPYYSFKIELVRLWLDRNRWFFSESA